MPILKNRRFVAALLSALLWATTAAALAQPAPKTTERSRRSRPPKAERAELRQKLTALKQIDRPDRKRAQDHAADALAEFGERDFQRQPRAARAGAGTKADPGPAAIS